MSSVIYFSLFVRYNAIMILISASPKLTKLEELILCIAERAPDIGVTKLEKLMYLCDFEAASILGTSITGDTYRNFQWGPVPKHFVVALNSLIQQKKIEKNEIALRDDKKFVQLTPLVPCEPNTFSEQEWNIVENVLGMHGAKNASTLVRLTHEELTWKMTQRNEEIPYFLAKYRYYKRPSQERVATLFINEDYLESIKRQLTL